MARLTNTSYSRRMHEINMSVRRRRYLLLRVADEPALDIWRFFRGEVHIGAEPRCSLLCPVRGESLPLTPAELALIMTVPADRWLTTAELQNMDGEARMCLLDLARRGVLLCDPAPESLNDLVDGEEVLEQMQWHDVAAVYQAHSRWKGVVGNNLLMKDGGDAHEVRLEELRGVRGDPPPHFVQRSD